jgi:hypothetical protein
MVLVKLRLAPSMLPWKSLKAMTRTCRVLPTPERAAALISRAASWRLMTPAFTQSLVRWVRAENLPGALEVGVVVEHVRLVGVDVPLGDAGDLRREDGEPSAWSSEPHWPSKT